MTLLKNTAYHSTSVEQMLLEVAMVLQIFENNDTFNTSNSKENRINILIDTDAKTVSISAILPISFHNSITGLPVIDAKKYLLTPGGVPMETYN